MSGLFQIAAIRSYVFSLILIGIASAGSAQAATLSVNQPFNLNFGNVAVGETSAPINIVFTTTLGPDDIFPAPLELSIFGPSAPNFSFTNNGCFAPVCNIDLSFSPLAVGSTPLAVFLFVATFANSIGVVDTINPAQAAFFLSGTGVEAVSQVPLPAALPLFATGLGLLGLFARRRKQIQVTT